MFNILVAEDDTNTRKWLAAVLRTNGFNPILAEDGQAALDLLDHYPGDLLIADIMMPNLDGLNLTRQLRASGSTLPVLMLTALQMPENKRQGFVVGTVDYMVKPVDDEEMSLRIRALIRRARIVSERRLTIGPVILDYDALSVSREGQSQTLPQKEFYLLFKLLSYPDVIFTRSADGRNLGHGFRDGRPDRQCPHQPPARTVWQLAGVRNHHCPWLGLQSCQALMRNGKRQQKHPGNSRVTWRKESHPWSWL
jgi:DNA-binding response OmpR family regulator